MAEVKLAAGTAWVQKKLNGDRKGFTTLAAILEEQANCQPCGCSSCYGYWTQINAETGELMMFYITGTDPYEIVIEPYDEGLVNVKALKATRDAS